MTDIMIKNSGLSMVDGDFATVSSVEEIKQQIILALNTFQGDWAINKRKGINYAYGMRNIEFLETDVRRQLLGVRNVSSVDKLNLTSDNSTLTIRISAIIKTNYGEIYLNETLNTQ